MKFIEKHVHQMIYIAVGTKSPPFDFSESFNVNMSYQEKFMMIQNDCLFNG